MKFITFFVSTFVVTIAQMQTPIKCINFYGLETPYKNFVCSWKNNPEFYLRRLKEDMQINTVRLPFSYEYISSGDISNMEEFIRLCQRLDIDIILDWHRTWSSHQGAIPEEGITLDIFVSAWINLLERFKTMPNVKGVGMFNEIQLLNDFKYTDSLHRYVVPMIESTFPGRFYYFLGCPSWGGNCSDMHFDDMPTWNRTYIEIHKYRFSGLSNRDDWDISMPMRISPDHWFIGEVGWKQQIDIDATWAKGFMQYLVQRNISNLCLWTIAHSGDTDGWFKDDCVTFDVDKAKEVTTTIWKIEKSNLRKTFGPIIVDPPLPPPAVVGGDTPVWLKPWDSRRI